MAGGSSKFSAIDFAEQRDLFLRGRMLRRLWLRSVELTAL
jgi:hypothetical protein